MIRFIKRSTSNYNSMNYLKQGIILHKLLFRERDLYGLRIIMWPSDDGE
jgi:hypothetical protein